MPGQDYIINLGNLNACQQTTGLGRQTTLLFGIGPGQNFRTELLALPGASVFQSAPHHTYHRISTFRQVVAVSGHVQKL